MTPAHPETPLRPPSQVMRLARMGAFFPTRLSFMRCLIRRLRDAQAQVTRPVWQIDAKGHGRAVYSMDLDGHTYSLVAFSQDLDPENRTDRVIAEAWDTTYVLFDGVPTSADLDRLAQNAPRQEAGRYVPSELILCRANKSVRLFNHVVQALAAGNQPDRQMIGDIGYLMRTTAVYGNGKFGIADRSRIKDRPALQAPFQAELLSVWLVRGFTLDLVEHAARAQNPKAARLDPGLRRYLGIGNSTGLGMAPFLVHHPVLLNNWMMVRETALARVRAVDQPDQTQVTGFLALLDRVRAHVAQWNVADETQMQRIVTLRQEIDQIATLITAEWLSRAQPWDALITLSEAYSTECQELLVALVLEPYGDLIDGLTDCMSATAEPVLRPEMGCDDLIRLITSQFDWALALDFNDATASQRFWYTSEEKLEPRLGDRYAEPGSEKEAPLDIARQVQALLADLRNDGFATVAEFLMKQPQHRQITARIQSAAQYPYAEIQDNLIDHSIRPIDLLRCKLSFFGASKFDPKSDLWTRITLFQGAPGFDNVTDPDADDWAFPVLGAAP